jgi:hypothetical protein
LTKAISCPSCFLAHGLGFLSATALRGISTKVRLTESWLDKCWAWPIDHSRNQACNLFKHPIRWESSTSINFAHHEKPVVDEHDRRIQWVTCRMKVVDVRSCLEWSSRERGGRYTEQKEPSNLVTNLRRPGPTLVRLLFEGAKCLLWKSYFAKWLLWK